MKLKKRQKKSGLTFQTCIKCGVKNTKENRQRFNKGEALDLILEADDDIEIKHDDSSTNIKLSEEFFEEQERAEKEFLENYYSEADTDTEENKNEV